MQKYELTRINTGIYGLDEMTEGGLPFPSTVLLAGGAGCGKTTFSLQFLFEGAKRGEKGIYFTTLSEPVQWLLRFASRYSFIDREALGKNIECIELGSRLRRLGNMQVEGMNFIEDTIASIGPQRVVIDPITVIKDLMGPDYRIFLYDLSAKLKNWQVATILTGEVGFDEPYPLEVSYIADGIILLSNTEEGKERRRYLEVLKMRGTHHASGKHLVDISLDGLTVMPGLK